MSKDRLETGDHGPARWSPQSVPPAVNATGGANQVTIFSPPAPPFQTCAPVPCPRCVAKDAEIAALKAERDDLRARLDALVDRLRDEIEEALRG